MQAQHYQNLFAGVESHLVIRAGQDCHTICRCEPRYASGASPSMSYKDRLSDIKRDVPASVTSQIVDIFAAAIAAGELGPDDKLPPTRELAEFAQVNHLTAARAYRRLAELGLVTARVGQGTFVRVGVQNGAGSGAERDNTDWQFYALPEQLETYGDRILAEMFRQAGRDDVIPLMVGYPANKLLPAEVLAKVTAATLEEHGSRVHQYTDIEGAAELREQIAGLHRAEGCEDSPDQIVVTTGAHQAMTLAARAILRAGDTVACESPTFPGSIEALRKTGSSVLPVPVDEGGLDIDALEILLRRRDIRLLTLQPRLHNPTGRDLAPERRERLCELALRYGFFIVEDEAYGPAGSRRADRSSTGSSTKSETTTCTARRSRNWWQPASSPKATTGPRSSERPRFTASAAMP